MTGTATNRSLRELLRVEPGSKVSLRDHDPSETFGHSRDTADEDLAAGVKRLAALQDVLWAEANRSVLVILQGIDAAGKDGTMRHVMGAFNPMGVKVSSFKAPTEEELAHDYLWRVHQRVPGDGEIGIFNRSHYEDVLVVRVHDIVPKDVWSRRYDQINAFERTLADEGTTIVKFFLWISKDEQRERFQARVDDPTKRWKFRKADLDERRHWDAYVEAFEDVLSRCSTEWAPWYVIPATRKWFRNVAVAEILADTIGDLKPQYPAGEEGIEGIRVV